jgi:glutathione S-transferase
MADEFKHKDDELTLFVDYMSQPSRAILLFCLENNIAHRVHLVQLAKGEQRTAAFKAVNPYQKVPAIRDANGFFLNESHAILRYLDQTRSSVASHWYPSDAKQRALVDAALDAHHTNLRLGASRRVFARFLGPVRGVPAAQLQALESIFAPVLRKSLRMMDATLAKQPYLCPGNEISIADLSSACEAIMLNLISFDWTPYPHVARWMERVAQRCAHWDAVHRIFFKVAKRVAAKNAQQSKL